MGFGNSQFTARRPRPRAPRLNPVSRRRPRGNADFLEPASGCLYITPRGCNIFAMAKTHKTRFVPGSTPQLNNPFAGLRGDVLPPGPAAPAPPASAPAVRLPKPGRVVLRRETARRAGKVVIVIDDFAPHIGLAAIEDLGRRLRQACGCGGAVRQRAIELQGNQAAKIRSFLEAEGFQVAGVT
jgi:translation initiation factor 1